MKTLILLLPCCAFAQFYNISTIAGNGRAQFGSGGQATSARLVAPRSVAVDAAGNFYVSDSYYNQVFRITPGGIITAYAGNGTQGLLGDGGPAASAQLFAPLGIAVDSAGNLFIADNGNSRIRKVSSGGVITTVAVVPTGVARVAADATGNLFVSSGHAVVKIDATGKVSPFAGNGMAGFSGDAGPATSAMLYGPQGLRVDASGNVFIADQLNNRIRKVAPSGTITTFAGNGQGGYAGDGAQASSAMLFQPEDVALDSKGNVFISDSLNGRLRKVDSTGVISLVAGGGGSLQDGSSSEARLAPNGIELDGSGNIVVAEFNYRRVRKVAPQQSVTTVAGVLPVTGAGDNVKATSVSLLDPIGVAVDAAGNVFIADYLDHRVRKVTPDGTINTATGDGIAGYSGDNGPAGSARITQPLEVSFDPSGNLFVSAGVVRKISTSGTISTVAGNGQFGFAGDGGKATAATFLSPTGVAADSSGNIFIGDRGNNRIRRVDPSGNISTIAGDGTPTFKGDGGPALSAGIFQPWQIAADTRGNLFIADWQNSRVRKIDAGRTISTVAGGGTASGDGGPATGALIGGDLYGVAVDASGNLYITSNARIRKVDAVTGNISTIAGTGTAGYSGDGGLATNAAVNGPQAIAVDSAGNIYFADQNNQRVRKLSPVQIVQEGVTNGATSQAGGVAPGEIVTIYGGPGVTLGPASPVGLQLDSSGRVATQLAGTQVMFDNVAAPLTYVSSGQINAVVPYGVSGQASTELRVVVQGKTTNSVTLPVVLTSPGVFAITNSDGSVNSASSPSPAGGTLVLYGTGEGQTNPAGVDGAVNNSVFSKPLQNVAVQIGGQNANVVYAGAAPGFVAGVLQVNVQIPAGISGTAPIQLSIGNASTPPGLTVSVR